MKQKLLQMIQVTVWLHTDEFIFVWFYKNENGRQNRSSDAKTELLRQAGATTPCLLKMKICFSPCKLKIIHSLSKD